MTRRRRAAVVGAVLVVVMIAAAAVAFVASPALRCALRVAPGFHRLAEDERVYLEPGAEREAHLLAAALPEAIAAVGRGHGRPFLRPFRVYVPATHESFVARLGQSPRSRVRGFALARDVWISPLAFDYEGQDTHRQSLAHELSHLHLAQHLGKLRQLRDVPTWFSEALADHVSGTGTETVSRDEARTAILAGHALRPDTTGRLPRPRMASDYGLTYPMLHAQSLLFVEHLVARDEAGWRRLVGDVLDGRPFDLAFRESYGEDLDAAWEAFVASLAAKA